MICPYCQTTGWPVILPCRCHEFTQRVHEIQLRGPHRIEDCVIDIGDVLDWREDWWEEWQDVGGEA